MNGAGEKNMRAGGGGGGRGNVFFKWLLGQSMVLLGGIEGGSSLGPSLWANPV